MVMAFLRSFFPTKEFMTRYLSLEVQRGTEKIAVDVKRGTEGNFNTFSKSTEKIFDPPYFAEWFNLNELDLYDRMIGSSSIDDGVYAALLEQTSDKMGELVKKIERAYEKMCADALTFGTITLVNGDSVDFKRKAGSLVANTVDNTWATGTVDPCANIAEGCTFLRTDGKVQGGVFNLIMGSTAFSDFINNTIIKSRADIRRYELVNVAAPQRNSLGASLHGQVSCGSYLVNLWTYPEYYEDANGTLQPYIDPKKVILLPEAPNFALNFAACPQLIDEQNPTVKTGAYLFVEDRNAWEGVHKYGVRSAGVPMLKGVDQVWTMQPVA
jgi:hypothetical protein